MAKKISKETEKMLTEDVNPHEFDHIIVCFSGGKDSVACFLHLLDLGVDKSKIELWHHDIDSHNPLFDWTCTPAYCKAFAKTFEVPLYFSEKVGGFEREMLRNEEPTAPIAFDTPDGRVVTKVKENAPKGTRLKFPQITANLSTRWCSAYLKIDVAARAVTNQKRFDGKKVLMITGERAEESPGRAKYAEFEPHRTYSEQKKRLVLQWRPVHKWSTADVWEIIGRYKVNAHPCYHIGFGRCSCAMCIFGNKNQFKTGAAIFPERFEKIVSYEKQFGFTMKRKDDMPTFLEGGETYNGLTDDLIQKSRSNEFTDDILLDEWVLPSGATGEIDGPC